MAPLSEALLADASGENWLPTAHGLCKTGCQANVLVKRHLLELSLLQGAPRHRRCCVSDAWAFLAGTPSSFVDQQEEENTAHEPPQIMHGFEKAPESTPGAAEVNQGLPATVGDTKNPPPGSSPLDAAEAGAAKKRDSAGTWPDPPTDPKEVYKTHSAWNGHPDTALSAEFKAYLVPGAKARIQGMNTEEGQELNGKTVQIQAFDASTRLTIATTEDGKTVKVPATNLIPDFSSGEAPPPVTGPAPSGANGKQKMPKPKKKKGKGKKTTA